MRRLLVSFFVFTIWFNPLWSQQADTSLINRYLEESDRLVTTHQYKPAIRYQEKALQLCREAEPPLYDELVNIYGNIGRLFRKAGNYDSSFVFLRKGIRLGEKYLPDQHLTVLKNYNSLGIYYFFQGNCRDALKNYAIVLEGYQAQLGPEDLEVANVYNNMALCHEQLDDYDQALDYYRQTFNIRYKQLGAGHPMVADCYLNMGNCYFLLGDYDQALSFYEFALAIWQQTLDEDDPDFASIYNNMGVCYQSKGDYRRAEYLLELALDQNIRVMGANHPDVANAYNNLGINFFDNGDYNRALIYYQKALAIRLEHFGEQHHKVASVYNHIGNCYRKKKDFNKAYEFCRRALNIRLKQFGENHREVADSYNDLGLYCEETKDYPSAIAFYRSSLDINLARLGPNHPQVANSYERTGTVYELQEDYDSAIRFYQQALDIKIPVLGNDHPEVAILRSNIARCLKEEPRKGLSYCTEVLATLDKNASNLSLTALLRTLDAQGQIQLSLYEKENSQQWLEKADATLAEARAVILDIRKGFQEPSSKQILLDNFFEVYEHSLEVKYLLYRLTGTEQYLEDAFKISEDSKGVLLQEAIQKIQADRFAGLPDSVYQMEVDLRIDLAFYEQLRFNEENKGKKRNSSRLADIRNHIFELKRQYYDLISTLEQEYPEYFSLRYGRSNIDLDKLKKEVLLPGQSLLEFFVGEEQVYLFLVSDDQTEMVRIRMDFPLSEWVRDLRSEIFAFDPLNMQDSAAVERFRSVAYRLYATLLGPLQQQIRDTSLIIIPDGPLGYLPFECLLTEPAIGVNSWKEMPYLIHRHQVSYHFTAGLLQQETDIDRRKLRRAPLLAVAPSFTGSDGLQALQYNQSEVEAIGKLLDGKILKGKEATEENFLKEAEHYRILHLATHAQANDTIGAFSYLAFYHLQDSIENERLFVKDLYNLRLGADMVVLSACETGIGEWQRGEGIVSLGRGFLFAGANSIVTTLWSVDDKPTAQIMEYFYQGLLAGKSKDAALREAKLSYLRQNSAIRAHPLFWAAQIPMGDMEAMEIHTRSKNTKWWWILAVPVMLIALFWYFQKPRSKNPEGQ